MVVNRMPPTLASQILQAQKNSEDKDENPPPKGFEKFFKKKDNDESKAAKKESKKKEEDDKKGKEQPDEQSDDEEAESSDKKEEKKDERNPVQQAFFDPEGNPKPEGFLGVLLAAATAYYILNYKKPMDEIVYMQFLNDYLLQGKIKEI